MFFWNSLAFPMIQQMLAIWFLVPLPFLNPVWKSGSSRFMYCWSLAWRILSIIWLACEMSAIVWSFEHSLVLPFFGIEVNTDLFQVLEHVRYYFELLSDFEEIILFRKKQSLKAAYTRRQTYWSGLPFPSPRDFPNPGIEPAFPTLAGGFFITEPPGKLIKIRQSTIYWAITMFQTLCWEFHICYPL